jgi:hypothetical protein
VIAAGNSYDDASLYSPAHVKSAIIVGSYDVYDRFSSFSNYGHAVNILAPQTGRLMPGSINYQKLCLTEALLLDFQWPAKSLTVVGQWIWP